MGEPKYEKDLKDFLKKEAKKTEIDIGRLEQRLNRIEMISKRFRNQAKHKEGDALEKLREQVLKVLRYNQAKKELTFEGLFDLLAGGSEEIDEEAWKAFFASADMEIRDLKVSLRPT